jgi:hypothetical protein
MRTIRLGLFISACLLPGLMLHAQTRMGSSDVWQRYSEKMGFSGDYSVTMETQSGGHTMRSRMARLAPKTRMEMDAPGMGQMIALHLPEEPNSKGGKGVSYTLFPATKTYMRMDASVSPDEKAKQEGTVKIEELGKETLDNQVCLKRRITITEPRSTVPHVVLLWCAAAVKNMPVRMETEEGRDKTVIRFLDYDFKKPDAALFQVPKDYTPGGFFPGAPGRGAAPDAEAMRRAAEQAAADEAAQAAAAKASAPAEAQKTPPVDPAQDAANEAKDAAKENTRNAVREGVNAGFRKAFGW